MRRDRMRESHVSFNSVLLPAWGRQNHLPSPWADMSVTSRLLCRPVAAWMGSVRDACLCLIRHKHLHMGVIKAPVCNVINRKEVL
jgi:hypothetical protein